MKIKTMKRAEEEAIRFLDRVETAAITRASMELTRALADLRQGR